MIKIIKDTLEIFEAFNGIIGLKFYKKGENKGNYEIRFRKNELIECRIQDCYSVINLNSQNNENLIEISSNDFNFKTQTEEINNQLGNGLKIIFNSFNNNDHGISFNIQFLLYEQKDFILIKLIDIKDNSQNQLSVHSISPLTIKDSALWLSGRNNPTNLHNVTWFKHGWQSWSRSKILFGKDKDTKGPVRDIFKMAYDNQDYQIEGRFYSEYCTVITDLQSKNSLILGFTTLKHQFSRVILDYENSSDLKLLTSIGCMDGILFKNTSINSSEELFICFKTHNHGYYGLIEYAKIISTKKEEKRVKSIPIGWCSWYYYFTDITQEDMIKNLEFFKNNKNYLPVDLIQLDDGYFEKIGDYHNINSKFPNGLKWLFKKIKKYGFQRGIWTAPFFGVKKSELFKNHQEWFLKKSGKILKTHFSVDWKTFLYSLDLSNKDVLEYLRNLFTNLLFAFKNFESFNRDPLINYFKIDFLHAAAPFGADYKVKNWTRAQLCHNGIKTIRDAITDNSFLLGCGAPLGPCVGLVDAMRISEDTAPLWEVLDNSEELKEVPRPALKEALINILYRSFMHKYFWINDPDCLMIRRTDTELSIDEIRLQMTIFGLSGGLILISDDMTKLSEEEINDAKLLIPPYNPKDYDSVVVDAFISQLPSIYILEAKEIIGKRYLVAIINWNDIGISKNLKILDIIPNLTETNIDFYVYDFWNEKFLGQFKSNDIIELRELKPHSCSYMNIIPVSEEIQELPILFSTNLHITQGCCEIKQFKYIKDLNQLNINIELKGIRKGFLLLKFPQNKKIIKSDFEYSKIESKGNLWKIFVRFKDSLSLNIYLN